MFERVLIANRGEIAVRIARTLSRLGIEAIAVYSDADAGAPHVRNADRAIRLGPALAAESYLSIERIIDAARAAGADAVHPGYGFLSERAELAYACRQAGVGFIGPSPEAIALLGDKAAAKAAATAAGVPVLDGLSPEQRPLAPPDEAAGASADLSDEQILEWAAGQELPLLVKAAGGGGGRGMRVVRELSQLPDALRGARREALAAFGDDRLIVERYVTPARHIEIQVIADQHGSVLHLGERECSLQRRHQKVLEEAPSPVLTGELRQLMGDSAVRLARSCSYTGLGTVELIAERDHPERFWFLEFNARLQVEHAVTEAVTGLDLVELQLRLAAGEKLSLRQEDVTLVGHAVQARIYAEDPVRDFLPSTGVIALYREPPGAVHGGQLRSAPTADAEELRVDSGVEEGSEVTADYDPMIAKVIAYAPSRSAALARLRRGLRRMRVLGPSTNIPWLLRLLERRELAAGELHTRLLEELGDALHPPPLDEQLAAGLALVALLGEPATDDPWDALDGWSVQGPVEARMALSAGEHRLQGAAMPEAPGRWRVAGRSVTAGPGLLWVQEPDGDTTAIEVHRSQDAVWLIHDGSPVRYAAAQRSAQRSSASHTLQAPMPGVVLDVRVQAGDEVSEGEVLIVLESMKMELSITSPQDGVLDSVRVATGDRVAHGQTLLELKR